MPRSLALRRPPAALSLAWLAASALALIAAEFLTFREIVAVAAVPAGGRTTGGAHHGYALAVVGAAALPIALGAVLGGSRAAAAALAALGAVALAIVLAVDLPGAFSEGELARAYESVEARPTAGFWLELAGAVALLAGGLLVWPSRS